MRKTVDSLIVGGGLFGLTAALELSGRGHHVAVLEQGQIPNLLAASTDISKVIRMEYGRDESYMEMAELARDGWLAWNDVFGEELYHEVGVTMLSRRPMAAGGYEYESYHTLLKRGHRPERLDGGQIARRFPAWNAERYLDGFFHALGGYAESGRIVERLAALARQRGIVLVEGQVVRNLTEAGGRVLGVETSTGDRFQAGTVIVAAGTWTRLLLPELGAVMRSVGQPVFHLRPDEPELFAAPRFTVFTADIANSGWYGFPLHPRERVVKVANHGLGLPLDPVQGVREVTAGQVRALRAFLADTFPPLAAAPIAASRLCLYCDTLDEHFWIDRHPEKSGLVVAAGGSGHGFKFGPLLGSLVADVVEGRPNRFAGRFRWRALDAGARGEEAARHHR
jgi:glycine/D-amino acid oxidase-like deaminating enzyme